MQSFKDQDVSNEHDSQHDLARKQQDFPKLVSNREEFFIIRIHFQSFKSREISSKHLFIIPETMTIRSRIPRKT